MQQSYSNPPSRNTQVAADSGAGKGMLPNKVSVPFPQKPNQPAAGKAKVGTVPGFSGGVMPGKV
jgi:hypothetical protein